MQNSQYIKTYSPAEERINIVSHTIGFILSLAALILLVLRAVQHGNTWHLVSFGLFGASLITLYASSTAYHKAKIPDRRQRLRIIDHAAIYILIAGTYTPFTLVTLKGTTAGWVIFTATWSMAALGVVLKLFFTGRYTLVSTLMYVFMGWMIVFAIKPLINNLSPEGMQWLVAGGLAYTFGAIVYVFKKIQFTHAVFHVFILLGSFCHFISVYFYVLPIRATL